MTGVSLAQIRLARAFSARGFPVDFFIGAVADDVVLPSIDGVRFIRNKKARAASMLVPIIKYFRREKPDIVFSAEDHLNIIVALAAFVVKSSAKISASSRITASRVYSKSAGLKGLVLKLFNSLSLYRIDVPTCVSKDLATEYRALFNTEKYQCFYNIIQDVPSLKRMEDEVIDPWFNNCSVPIVVAAGTLTKRKGFDDLINAFAIVVRERPAKLAILGEGYQRGALQALIDQLDLNESVRLLGFQSNPLKYFAKSDIFVLSSYAEGLPNVLVEAMMCGCSPVATDCPTGPREVLLNGAVGHLIPMHDPGAMASAIIASIDNPVSKCRLMQVIEPFSEDVVVASHRAALGF